MFWVQEVFRIPFLQNEGSPKLPFRKERVCFGDRKFFGILLEFWWLLKFWSSKHFHAQQIRFHLFDARVFFNRVEISQPI